MPPERVAAALERLAGPRDRDGAFPAEAMRFLVERGWTSPEALVPAPSGGGMARLLERLVEAGHGDASVGRLLEGHANALELLDRLAPPTLRTSSLSAARDGALYGVWGADPPEGRLRAEPDGTRFKLEGAKLYCSGADGLDAALVLADGPGEGRLLLFVPIGDTLGIDRDAWRPLGMRASGSHRVVFDGVSVPQSAVVCDGAAYLGEPWFSGGAVRFAAVQAGVACGLAATARDHLARAGRAAAPHQAARLGRMAVSLAGLDGVLATAARTWDAGTAASACEADRARAAAGGHLARVAAERTLLEVADIVQRAVGLGGLIAPHPLERRLRDALTYVRQPNPDGALEALGTAFADGRIAPFER